MIENKQAAWRKFLTPSNIILIITLAVGLIAIPVRTFGQGASIVEQTTLAVVTLLAGAQQASSFSAIKQEEKWEAHQRVQQDIVEVIKNFPSGRLKRRNDILPLEEFAESARGVLIIARTASKVAARFKFFRKQLEHGCRLRFVVTDPEAFRQNDIEAVTPMPLTGTQALEIFTAELRVTLQNIEHIRSLSADTPGKVEVRLVNYISNMSFVAVNEGNGRGKIIMELMPYKCQELDRPHIQLSSRDSNTYRYELGVNTSQEILHHATPLPV